jgi:STE24 endopeptidase
MVMGFLLAWVPFRLLDRSPRRWWLYTGLLVVPFLFFMTLIKPVAIDPLFNDFGPMKDKALEARIQALAGRAGIVGSRIYEVDKSRDTKTVNAYVTGFLDTKRIVLWDTILAKLDERELMFVLGHEMGHYVLNHVVQGILFSSVLILLGLGFVDRAGSWLIRRKGNRLGIDRLGDVAALPLILMLAQVAMLVLLPIGFTFSRWIEHEADRFALELTRDNRAGALSFVELQRDNLGVPRPGWLYKVWRASHPSLGDRIDFCNRYRPWEDGRPLRYDDLFREAIPTAQPARGRADRASKIRAT